MDETFVRSIGIVVIAGAMVALAARSVALPTIVAYLAAGLLLGPITGLLEVSDAIHLIAEAGIVLLLFLVGLELSFEKIRGVGLVACVAGVAQVLLTGTGGFFLCRLLGFDPLPAVILGIALTFSSTVIVVKLLVDNRDTNQPFGQIAIGILLVQDLFVVVLLTLVTGLAEGDSFEPAVVGGALVRAFSGMALLLLVVLAASRWLLKRPFTWAARSPETLFILSLCWCFLVVSASHLLHLSPEIGAFLAGISLAQLPYHRDLQRRVRPLMNFFIAVFFVSLGIEMKLDIPLVFWLKAAALAGFVVVGKFVIIMAILTRLRYPEKTCYFAALMLTQVSEFSFIFLAQGIETGLVDEIASGVLGLLGLMSIVVSTVAIVFREPLYRTVKRWGLLEMFRPGSGDRDGDGGGIPEPEDHVIIVGLNSLGRELAVRLHERGEQVLAIDIDPHKPMPVPGTKLVGDAETFEVLQDAGLERAKLLISTLHIEPTNDLQAYWCRREGIPCSIHAADLREADNLLEMEVQYLLAPKADGINRLNRELKRIGFLD